MPKSLRPETIALHGGQKPDSATNARAVPIYQTSSYVFDDTQHAADLFALAVPGNIYTRIMNPTWDVLEQRLAALEGGIAALVTASGQAAVTYSVLNVTRAGENIISVSQLYGGTYNLFAHTLPQYGIEVRWADADDPGAVARLADDKTRLVFGETIGNPRLNVLDVEAWASAAHAAGTAARARQHGADADRRPHLRAGRRHRRALADEVHRWPRNLDRRRDRRQRQVRLARARRPLPRPDQARPVLPRRRLDRRARTRPRTSAAPGRSCCATPARRCRRSTRSCSCRASRRCRCGWSATTRTRSPSRGISMGTRTSPGSTTRASSRARTMRSPSASCAGGYGALVTFGVKGGASGRPVVHRAPAAVQPPCQHRRREVAGDPQRLHDPLAAQRG